MTYTIIGIHRFSILFYFYLTGVHHSECYIMLNYCPLLSICHKQEQDKGYNESLSSADHALDLDESESALYLGVRGKKQTNIFI